MKKIEDAPVVIMNFSGAYKLEDFAANPDFIHLDLTHLSGTDCFCDEAAEQQLAARLEPFGPRGMHFIDSGDYHYVTKLWTDQVREPFTLVLFDHHPDLQETQVPGLLSCGSWVRRMLESNRWLREVVVIGIPTASKPQLPPTLQAKVRYVFAPEFLQILHGKGSLRLQNPLYISIDKDVLNPQSAVTNWDQGTMSLADLRQMLALLMTHQQVIGIDVCGEYPLMKSLFEEEEAASVDNEANVSLLDVAEEYEGD